MSRYPNLSNERVISVDIETRDPDILELGPSNYRNKGGYILGIALGTEHHQEYYDYSNEHDRAYCRDVLSLPCTKVGHNLLYDIDWLQSQGLKVGGKLFDVMVAEALIDNNKPSYNLASIGQDYMSETKADEQVLYALAKRGIKPTKTRPVQDYLYLLDHDEVRPYAIQDINIPLKAWKRQERLIESMGLTNVFDIESRLLRVLLHMRKLGVPYSKELSLQSSNEARKIIDETNNILNTRYSGVNPNSGDEVAYCFRKLGIPYPVTEKGNPSIRREYLEHLIEEAGYEKLAVADYLPLLVHTARRLGKSERDYIEGIRENFLCEDGMIRGTFHPTRGENYGTVSGRFSCSHPNLQQMTSKERDLFIGGLVRRAFVPLPEHDWIKIDYSQIEYRFMAHYAKGPGSQAIRDEYNNNPDTDYHAYIVDLTGLPRPIAKNLNFGIAFGMGTKKMRGIYGWSQERAWEILNTYHDNAPFVKYSMRDVERVSIQRGRIKTILGRIAHLPDKRKAYIMYNRLIQGSAADLMKKSMVDIYESGLMFDMHLHLTVHDELDFSVPKGEKQIELIREAKSIMESAIKLRVPVAADVSIGSNWGDVEELRVT